MKLARVPAAVVLSTVTVFLIPLAAVAADEPKPIDSAPVTSAAPANGAAVALPAPAVGLADLPENQAESAAVAAGELKLARPDQPAGTAAGAPAVEAARAARRAALDAVLAEQDARVQELASRLPAADSRTSLEIQKQIEQVKKESGRRLLEAQLELATGAGDQAAIEKLQAALADWDAPRPVLAPVDRPAPLNQGR